MNKETISQIVEKSVTTLKFILIECTINHGKNKDLLKIIIHHPSRNITSDDCSLVADIISRQLDIDDPFINPYDLVVESPGIEREFKTQDEYQYFIGKEVKVFLDMNSSFITKEGFVIGKLNSITQNSCTLIIDNIPQEILFNDIKKTKLYCNYEEIFKKNKK